MKTTQINVLVEKGVPYRLRKIYHYPFSKMEIGDSFIVPLECRHNLQYAMSTYTKKHPKFIFVSKKIDLGIRVWRVKDKKDTLHIFNIVLKGLKND